MRRRLTTPFVALAIAMPAGVWMSLDARSGAPATTVERHSAMPASLKWRIDGLRARGESSSTVWTARVGRIYEAGARFGPFRFQPLTTLQMKDLHLDVTSRDQGESAARAVRDGADKLSRSMSMPTAASRVSVLGFHLDLRDDAGRLRCCVEAEHASWERNDGANIELDRAVRIRSEGDSRESARAILGIGSSTVVAPVWKVATETDRDLPHESDFSGSCPLLLTPGNS